MKRILLGIYMFVVALSVWAVPARPSYFKVTQPDGTELVVRSFGDEFYHGLMTEDGTVVARDDAGWYRSVCANTLDSLITFANEKRQRINQSRMARLAPARRGLQAQHDVGVRCPYEGNKRGLVILVNFTDKKLSFTQEQFNRMFNENGYSDYNHIGSVKDYFYDQSYGKLTIDFDVVGPIAADHDYAYYGKNDASGNDTRVGELIVEACQKADSLVDYSKYDWGGNGEVDQVYVVYAGYGENYTDEQDPNTIWPHEYTLTYAGYYSSKVKAQYMDGVKIDTYACSSELAYSSGKTLNGIGVACHEFSHCLGFPDFYDSQYKGCPSMGSWDLLDAGSYSGANGLGECPAGMSAYERWIGGWLEFSELKDPCIVENMPNLGDSARAYIIYNENERYEAYILENRQNKKWFKYPSNAHGMLIVHVDYDEYSWEQNVVNSTPSHPRMVIVPANNTYGEKVSYGNNQYAYSADDATCCGQVWPGTSNKTALTNTTTPAAKTYNNNTDGTKFLNAPIENIKESNGLISFNFKGGIVMNAPELAMTADSAGIHLSWNEVDDATAYELLISSCRRGSKDFALKESLGSLVASTDGAKDLSSTLDKYTDNPGWTGERVYAGKRGAKLGTASTKGTLVSPAIDATGEVTVSAKLTNYSTDSKNVNIHLLDSVGNTIDSKTATAAGNVVSVVLSGATAGSKIKFAPTKRVYICDIEISIGNATTTKDTISVGMATSYTLSEVSDTLSYKFQVRAIGEKITSEWSPVVTYETESAVAIENIEYVVDKKNIRYDLFGRKMNRTYNKFQIINNQLIYQVK